MRSAETVFYAAVKTAAAGVVSEFDFARPLCGSVTMESGGPGEESRKQHNIGVYDYAG